MTHEGGIWDRAVRRAPNAIDVETWSFEESLERFPDDRSDDEELVGRAMKASRG
jgi:hypothetical protein